MPKDPNEIGALWRRKSQSGVDYMSGKIDGRDVVVFANKNKKEGDRTPDYRVLVSKPRDSA